jgi:TonB family protein
MNHQRFTTLFALWMFSILIAAPSACASSDVEDQLKSDYLDKVLTLRHFYKGDLLRFQFDGAVVGVAEVGPWTVDGQIFVKSIEVRGRALDIQGRRVCLVFDNKAKPYRDVLESLAESSAKDKDKLAEPYQKKIVEIQIGLASEHPDLKEIVSAMNAVFLEPGESIREVVPDFWRDYFDQLDGQPRSVRHSTEPVYVVKPGEISPPRQTYAPSPEFSEDAPRAKYQGSLTLSLVVDASGATRDIEIASPLGLGLDEKAVASVSTWKFEPAKKDGEPVAVKIEVEVDFHLY